MGLFFHKKELTTEELLTLIVKRNPKIGFCIEDYNNIKLAPPERATLYAPFKAYYMIGEKNKNLRESATKRITEYLNMIHTLCENMNG